MRRWLIHFRWPFTFWRSHEYCGTQNYFYIGEHYLHVYLFFKHVPIGPGHIGRLIAWGWDPKRDAAFPIEPGTLGLFL